jgi:hypothetical protein
LISDQILIQASVIVHHDVEAQVWLFLELDQFLIEVADVVKRQPRNRVLNPKPL